MFLDFAFVIQFVGITDQLYNLQNFLRFLNSEDEIFG